EIIEVADLDEAAVDRGEGGDDRGGAVLFLDQVRPLAAEDLVVGVEHVDAVGHLEDARAVTTGPRGDLTEAAADELDVGGGGGHLQCLATGGGEVVELLLLGG